MVKNHGIQDVSEVLAFLETRAEADTKMRMTVQDAASALEVERPPKLLDVGSPQEFELAHIENARLFTKELNMQMSDWPRDCAILFVCHDGKRSMDAASFFVGHAFTNVQFLDGGIDAWSREIDNTVPRYETERGPATRQGVIRPPNRSFQP